MPRSVPKTGEPNRPTTFGKGKRRHGAIGCMRSPMLVKTPAPWYCPKGIAAREKPTP